MEEVGVVVKNCAECGAAFNCYRTSKKSCWCEDFSIPAENLKLLAEKYNNCLCPECLANYGEKKK